MKIVNFNIDNWSMLDLKSDPEYQSEAQFTIRDVIAAAEHISSANMDDEYCLTTQREYTH